MRMRTFLAATAAALSLAGLAGSADAAGGIGGIPLIDEIKESTHNCGGQFDFACKDGSGAFCTVWIGRCSIGL